MIAVDFDSQIYGIDSNTGATWAIAPGENLLINSMAKNSAGQIYVAGSDASGVGHAPLALLDLDRARFTIVADVPLQTIRGMAFGSGDVLYAIESGFADIDDLYTIDPLTGMVQFVGSTGHTAIQSLAYWNGLLYAYDNANLVPGPGLVTIDPATAQTTDVNPAVSSGTNDFQTLCFDSAGVLYGASTILATIDTMTGKPDVYAGLYPLVRGMEFMDPIPYAMRLTVVGACPGTLQAAIMGGSPRDRIAFLYSIGSSGPVAIPSGPCRGTVLELGANASLGVMSNSGQFGNARSIEFPVPAVTCGQLRIQALNLTTCETSNVVLVD
ncbi:MAG: hypothetical protein EYC70_01895 [Planctomycetota bacterium]|nr:MAG: hypothetical protein EYC70_01895 [Planctomycetota bacterium]